MERFLSFVARLSGLQSHHQRDQMEHYRLLKGSTYADTFGGGVFTRAFLNTHSYYRQHAPVDGKVVEARVTQGQFYLETTVVSTNGQKSLQAVRRMTGQNTASFSPQTVDAPDELSYHFV
jgi:phosphatidylserine decarboxylase